MKLTFEQTISAANGIVRTEQNDLGLELHRFTREQEAFFIKLTSYIVITIFLTDTFQKIVELVQELL